MPARRRPEALTPRESQILELIWAGLKNKEIANRLNISVKTVEAHRATMMKKLRVLNTAQLPFGTNSSSCPRPAQYPRFASRTPPRACFRPPSILRENAPILLVRSGKSHSTLLQSNSTRMSAIPTLHDSYA
ncbi:MAG: hypothetical protein C4294_13040 [Nitrospiraceae bacterium]